MAANEIVYFDSSETGAPVLNNVAGSLIAVLDACLINGFNLKPVASLAVASGVATVTCNSHGYFAGAGRMVDVAGVAGGPSGYAALNGRKKVLSVTTNTFTFSATGVGDGTATGTITTKKSALGWTKQYTGTNKAMYKRSDVLASAMMLRIDDTGAGIAAATYARALMVEAATDVDTYTGGAPTAAQIAGPGHYWSKGANSTAAKQWLLVGDGRTFHLFTEDAQYAFASYGGLDYNAFGDLISYRSVDAYRGFVAGGNSTSNSLGSGAVTSYPGSSSGLFPMAISRSFSQIGGAVSANMVNFVNSNLMGQQGTAFPSPIDSGAILVRPTWVAETNTTGGNPIRGEMPGVVGTINVIAKSLDRQVISNPTGFTGDLINVATVYSSGIGCLFIDLTGPWQ